MRHAGIDVPERTTCTEFVLALVRVASVTLTAVAYCGHWSVLRAEKNPSGSINTRQRNGDSVAFCFNSHEVGNGSSRYCLTTSERIRLTTSSAVTGTNDSKLQWVCTDRNIGRQRQPWQRGHWRPYHRKSDASLSHQHWVTAGDWDLVNRQWCATDGGVMTVQRHSRRQENWEFLASKTKIGVTFSPPLCNDR